MDDLDPFDFERLVEEDAVLRTYRQVFAVLAKEAEKMVTSPDSLDIDRAILDAFALSGSEGMTEDQVCGACPAVPESQVRRRFEVMKAYGAVTKVFERRNQRYYRAAFAPYIMLLFLARMSKQGGMSELHQLLSIQQAILDSPSTTVAEGLEATQELTYIFRLVANDLSGLAVNATLPRLREQAPMLWGNEDLIRRANRIHESALTRWPAELGQACHRLRTALASYKDALDAASSRLLDNAGSTQALGMLPAEAWKRFARHSAVEDLAEVLTSFVFDAAAPWFDPHEMTDAVTSGPKPTPVRGPPPRSSIEGPPDDIDGQILDNADDDIVATCEEILADSHSVEVPAALRQAGDWHAARRMLADMTAAHHHEDLPYELTWNDSLDMNENEPPSWTTTGEFRRTGQPEVRQ